MGNMKGPAEEPKGEGGVMYHIGLSREDIGKIKIALLPGDPDRVPRIAAHLRDARQLGSHREYNSYAGYAGDNYIMVTSTGIGSPAAAIAIEELARLGINTMIRVGTCGAIRKDIQIGTLIVADCAVRLDGTSAQYVMQGYPAAATPEVVMALKEAAIECEKEFVVGIAASTDSFYVGQGREGLHGYMPSSSKTLLDDLKNANVACFEMESAALFTIGRIYNIKTGAIFAAIANRESGEFTPDIGVEDAIMVAIKAASRL